MEQHDVSNNRRGAGPHARLLEASGRCWIGGGASLRVRGARSPAAAARHWPAGQAGRLSVGAHRTAARCALPAPLLRSGWLAAGAGGPRCPRAAVKRLTACVTSWVRNVTSDMTRARWAADAAPRAPYSGDADDAMYSKPSLHQHVALFGGQGGRCAPPAYTSPSALRFAQALHISQLEELDCMPTDMDDDSDLYNNDGSVNTNLQSAAHTVAQIFTGQMDAYTTRRRSSSITSRLLIS